MCGGWVGGVCLGSARGMYVFCVVRVCGVNAVYFVLCGRFVHCVCGVLFLFCGVCVCG
jgi:hypothetical protein